ncbi:MAG: hypothetical protein VXX85_01355 [Candidatus Margulisiibacteriota bacterium]|nr:hypothetical protein [Candidatus Margulisiibacteriota bacterium]
MLRILPKTIKLLKTNTQYHQINRAISSTKLINRQPTAYKVDHTLHKNKTENNKPKTPKKKLTIEERVKQDLERANRIEAARYLFARPGQKNK